MVSKATAGPALRASDLARPSRSRYLQQQQSLLFFFLHTYPNANIFFKAVAQIASPQAAEATPRAVRGSVPSRHGRRIVRTAGVHANAIRLAQPEGHSGSDHRASLDNDSFCLFITFPVSDEPRTGAWAGSKSKEVRRP